MDWDVSLIPVLLKLFLQVPWEAIGPSLEMEGSISKSL